MSEFNVTVWQDEDRMFVAECSDIRGCVTEHEEFEGLMENMKDAICGCMAVLGKEVIFPITFNIETKRPIVY